MKQYIPKSAKLKYQLIKRKVVFKFLNRHTFAKHQKEAQGFPAQLKVAQEIKQSYLYENKVHNLKIAAARVSNFLINPGEVFSFWQSVGPPTAKNGYKIGRNIIKGELKEDYGGGLCQLSGLIYSAAIKAGLEIIERHNHSVELYTDETRYAPLGMDATVVYGYKDLMVKNTSNAPLRLKFEVKNDRSITVFLCSSGQLKELELKTIVTESDKTKEVKLLDEKCNCVSVSTYKLL